MPEYPSRAGRSVVIAATAALALALAAPAAAHADSACGEADADRVFAPWLDYAWYTAAPDGGLEDGGASWRLDGASVQDADATDLIGDAADRRSLRISAGGSATTAPMCIGLEHPTIRFFARNTGSPLSLLRVSVIYDGLDGERRSLLVGTVVAGSTWAPTLPMPIVANLLSLLGDQHVQFRFTPTNVLGLTQGRWSIDDVFVDPYRKG
jgi:hypothetical protein